MKSVTGPEMCRLIETNGWSLKRINGSHHICAKPGERKVISVPVHGSPRSGIAAFSGEPHHYDCEWNHNKQDYGDTFVLTPIGQDTLSLAMEQWSIWRGWEDAFHRGDVPQSTHPGLPGSHGRYAELEEALKARIHAQSAKQWRAHGIFRAMPLQEDSPPGVIHELEVEWTEVEPR